MSEGDFWEFWQTKGSEIDESKYKGPGAAVPVLGLERRQVGHTGRVGGGDEVRGVCKENTPPPIFKICVL